MEDKNRDNPEKSGGLVSMIARQRTRKREGEFHSIYFIVGGKVWNMDRGTGMRLRKVCPQCSTVIHARRSICECGHAFTLKREALNTASSPAKRKRALESLEDTLRRQENNRIRMASMRSSETQVQTLERLEQNRTHIASMRASETQEQTLERLEQKRTHVASMRASEKQEQTLERLEKNRMRITSMRASETQEQTLERLEQNRTHIANMRASETLHVKLHKR